MNMKPTAVKHSKFKLIDVVYDDGEYTVAWGTWEGTQKRLAERWNGEDSDPGWPRQGKYPTWMIVTDDLTTSRLKSLLGLPHAKDAAILKVLTERCGRGRL
jgi:hypothetical protein